MTTASSPGDPFDALGDPQRRQILRLLADADRSVAELAEAVPISRPAVSRHPRVLKGAGLVIEEPRGTRRIYRLQDEGWWPCSATSSRSGAGREPGSACSPRTPKLGPPMTEPLSLWTTLLPHFTSAVESA